MRKKPKSLTEKERIVNSFFPTPVSRSEEDEREKSYQKKSFLIWMSFKDQGFSDREADENTAKAIDYSANTVAEWRRKFRWEDRYDEHMSNIFLLAAAAHQPELRKQADTIIAALTTTRMDVELRIKRYYLELEEYDVLMRQYEALSPEDRLLEKQVTKPKMPVPPFKLETIQDILKYSDILTKFIGEDDQSQNKPDVKNFSIQELKAVININNASGDS